MIETCRFCKILLEHSSGATTPEYDTVIFETKHFIVVPALGALVSGYVMIVTKEHLDSIAYLDDAGFEEFILLNQAVRTLQRRLYGIAPIVFEHGSAVGCSNKSACCVDHAHVHIAPIHLSDENRIIQHAQMKCLENIQAVRNYKDTPYMLYINESNRCYISADTILPSQYMRKWVAKEVDRPLEWDWRQFEFLDHVDATLRKMKGVELEGAECLLL